MKNKINYKEMENDALNADILAKEKEMRNLSFAVQGSANKNTKAKKNARLAIARAKTSLRAKLG